MNIHGALSRWLGPSSTVVEQDLLSVCRVHGLVSRDIVRLVEDLRLRTKGMGEEFHAGDLVRLSLIRTRHPQLYSALMDPATSVHLLESHLAWTNEGIKLFSQLVIPGRREDEGEWRSNTRATVERLLAKRTDSQKAALLATLSALFPQVQRSFADSPDAPGKDDTPLFDEWRAAHPDVWQFYVNAEQAPSPYRGPKPELLASAAASGSASTCAERLLAEFEGVASHPGWRHAFLLRLLAAVQSPDKLSLSHARTVTLAVDRLMPHFRDEGWGRNPFIHERTIMAGTGWRLLSRLADDDAYRSEFTSLFAEVAHSATAERLTIYALSPGDFQESLERSFPVGLSAAACTAFIEFFRRWAWPDGALRDIFGGGQGGAEGFQTLGRLASIGSMFKDVAEIQPLHRTQAIALRDEYLDTFVEAFPGTVAALREQYAEQMQTVRGQRNDVELVFGKHASRFVRLGGATTLPAS